MDPTTISVSEASSVAPVAAPSLAHDRLEALDPAVSCVAFGAAYVYSPHGAGPGCSRSRLLRARLKSCDSPWLSRYVDCIQDEIHRGGRLVTLFGSDVILVPIPPCSASSRDGCHDASNRDTARITHHGTSHDDVLSDTPAHSPWVALRLAELLCETGLAAAVVPALSRSVQVRKSATAARGQRPTVLQHYRSFAFDAAALAEHRCARLLLVDDIVTKGRTFLAAAWRVQESCPAVAIRAFATLRTMSCTGQFRRLFDPCLGEITWTGDDACRYP